MDKSVVAAIARKLEIAPDVRENERGVTRVTGRRDQVRRKREDN